MSLEQAKSIEPSGAKCGRDVMKWLNDNPSYDYLKLVEIGGDKLTMNLDGTRFNLTIPSNYPKRTEFITIQQDDATQHQQFFSQITEWMMDSNPRINKLLEHLAKMWKKYTDKPPTVVTYESTMTADLDMLRGYDPEVEALKTKLMALAKTSHMDFVVDESKEEKSTKIFDQSSCNNLIVHEFMEVYKKYKGSDQIEISLVNDNLFHWSVKLRNFKNRELTGALKTINDRFGYDYVEIHLLIHSSLFPCYPVVAKCVRPKLDNSLMHRIPNMQIFQFDRWSPTRPIVKLVDKLYEVLENHGVVSIETELNDIKKNPDGAFFALESSLMKLASLFDASDQAFEPLDTEEYPMCMITTKATGVTTPKAMNYGTPKSGGWKKGTGYGGDYGNTSQWDPEQYKKMQLEKNKQVSILIAEIYNVIVKHEGELLSIYKTIQHSYLIPYIKTQFDGTSLIEISRHQDLYRRLIDIITVFTNEDGIFLFDDHTKKNLFNILVEIVEKNKSISHIKDADDDKDGGQEIIKMIQGVVEMAAPSYAVYESTKEAISREKSTLKKEIKPEVMNPRQLLEKQYIDTMKPHQIGLLGSFTSHKFSTDGASFKPPREFSRKMREEMDNLMKSSPLHFESSVIHRFNSSNISLIKTMITGPHDTPYDSGVFIFDTYVHAGWPQGPPKVLMVNTGGHRFNPNLYNCGKVCLSLLGTWSGQAGEGWIAGVSTLHQVYASIQSLILIDQPYFNEPGYQGTLGSPQGDLASKNYNRERQLYTMEISMIQCLTSPPPEFADAIKLHFKMKRDHIKETIKKWGAENPSTKMTDYSKKLIGLLDKL